MTIANAWRIGGNATVSYLEGAATGKAPPGILLVGSPGLLPSPIVISVSTPGPLGTAVLIVQSSPLTTAATDATVGRALSTVATAGGASALPIGSGNSLVLFLSAGQYDISNVWTFNFGRTSLQGATAVGLPQQDIVAAAPAITDSVLARVHTEPGSFTVTLPANPWDGMQVAVKDADQAAATNAIIVAPSGSNVAENPYNLGSIVPSSPVIRIPGQMVTWAYDAYLGLWRVVGDSCAGELPSVALPTGSTLLLTGKAFVKCSPTGGACTLDLPVLPNDGLRVRVKDVAGTAATHNITVRSTAASVGIDSLPVSGLYAGGGPSGGSAGVIMNSNYECVDFVFDALGNGTYTGGIWWITQLLTH